MNTNREKVIDFIIDNEDIDDLREDLKKYFRQIEKTKEFIYFKYFDMDKDEWINKNAQQVYYYLDFNNNEID